MRDSMIKRLMAAFICLVAAWAVVGLTPMPSYREPFATDGSRQAETSTQEWEENNLARDEGSDASEVDDAYNGQPQAMNVRDEDDDEGPRYAITSPDSHAHSQLTESETAELPPYVPETVLLRVTEGTSAARVNELVETTDAVVSQEVSTKQLGKGLIELQVAPGFSVEEAVAALDGADDTIAAQPDYLYYALLGDEADLRLRLSKGRTRLA